MRTAFYIFWVAILAAACTSNTTDQAAAPGEWQVIFNGNDLDGWETMGQLETKVEGGALHIHASQPNNNAWVMTSKSYQDFLVELEFYMPDTTANSGVAIRFDPGMEGTPNKTAYEANIDWRTDIQNPMGTLENAARAKLLENPAKGDWNKMRIEANGDHLKVFINDEMVCETHNRRAKSGRIGLQVPINQGNDIAFRNIRVMELPPVTELEPLVEDQYRSSDRPLQAMFNGPSFEGWHTMGPGVWNFEGEVLHGISGDVHSFLVSDKTYRNFYLKCNFKIVKDDNSGIFIRKHPDSTAVSVTDAIECNIYDYNGFAHAYSTGSIVNHARAWSKMIDYTDWNEMEIFAHNEHIILYINGKKSAESYLPTSFDKSGNICLQAGTRVFTDNGPSDIYFKDVMIREMD